MKLAFMSAAHVHADAYVSCLQSMPDVEIIGIADHDSVRGKAFASRYGLSFFESYDTLLAQKPDGVLITSENAYHKDLSLKAIKAGAHILCEKPLATNVKDAETIVRSAHEAKILLMTAFPMRFSVPVRSVRDELLRGKLGKPLCFNASNQGQLPPRDRAWFTDPVLAGGGAIIDHVVHLADVMRWYLGTEIVEVYAVANRIFHAQEVEIETGAMVSLQFKNDVFATINCSWSRPSTWPSWGGLSFDLITDRGAIHVDAFKQNLTIFNTLSVQDGVKNAQQSTSVNHDWSSAHGDRGLGPRWLFWGSDANQMMIEEFITAVREHRAPMITGEDGLHAVQVVDAAYRSIQERRPIRI